MDEMPGDAGETVRLLARVRAGDRDALEQLLARHRGQMRRMVELRMAPQMRSRLDVSDVIQEALLEVARRIDDYLDREPMPFHLWLRKTTYENLLRLRRQHVEAECRAVGREVGLPDHSSVMLARQLLGAGGTPSQQIMEQELVQRVHAALGELAEVDREVLLMRTLEGLDNQEAAQVLGIEPAAASKRYGRALLRLRTLLVAPDAEEALE